MSVIRRSRTLRVLLRGAIVLIAVEATLALAAPWIERHAGIAGSAECDDAIVCVGDSNTFGVGAPPGRSYPDQLRELLQAGGTARHVVNVSFPGLTTRLMLDRFEHALAGARPACVLFLGGANDLGNAQDLIDLPEADGAQPSPNPAHYLLSHLRSYRMALALYRVATHDTARAEYGGRRKGLPAPISVPPEQWDREYARAKAAGLHELLDWQSVFWCYELPDLMDRFLADLRARPDFAATCRVLRMPVDHFQWEADVVNGRATAPLVVDRAAPPDVQAHADYTIAWTLLADGQPAAARDAFLRSGPLEASPWGAAFRDLMVAWTSLIERDFVRSRDLLTEAVAKIEGLSPSVGLLHALGATAVSVLLADDHARLADFVAAHPAWKEQLDWKFAPNGQEWMVLAECVDAIKSGDAAESRRRLENARTRFGRAPITLPLRWLVAHPDATFDDVRRQVVLEPPRLSWLGERGLILRFLDPSELRQIVEASLRRLAALSEERSFPVVLLTYLDYEGTIENDVLREAAALHHWPLVDHQAIYPAEEVGADDKRRYFSPDRFHPNESGYGLMARAILPSVRQLLESAKH